MPKFVYPDRFETGKRTSARMNLGTKTSTLNINFGTLLFHGVEVNISNELGVEVKIWVRSPQFGAELLPCRTSIAPFEMLATKSLCWRLFSVINGS